MTHFSKDSIKICILCLQNCAGLVNSDPFPHFHSPSPHTVASQGAEHASYDNAEAGFIFSLDPPKIMLTMLQEYIGLLPRLQCADTAFVLERAHNKSYLPQGGSFGAG